MIIFCKSYKNVGWTLQEKDREKVYNVTVLKAHVHPMGIVRVCYCLQALLLFSLAI